MSKPGEFALARVESETFRPKEVTPAALWEVQGEGRPSTEYNADLRLFQVVTSITPKLLPAPGGASCSPRRQYHCDFRIKPAVSLLFPLPRGPSRRFERISTKRTELPKNREIIVRNYLH
jgi:hypothetical protein